MVRFLGLSLLLSAAASCGGEQAAPRVAEPAPTSRALTVRVLSASGAAAPGIPLELVPASGVGPLWRGTTNRVGVATIDDFGAVGRQARAAPGMVLRSRAPIHPALALDVDADRDRVELRLQPGAVMALAVHHQDGTPILAATDFELRGGGTERHEVHKPGGLPELLVPVAPGTRFGIRAIVPGAGVVGSANAEAPDAPGTRTEVAIVMTGGFTILTGRLNDSAGSTVRDATVEARFVRGERRSRAFSIETDAQGGFELIARLGPTEDDSDLLLTDADGRRGLVTLAAGFRGARRDLSEVTLAIPALLTEGEVVDHEGKPVHDCRVQAERRIPAPGTATGFRWARESAITVEMTSGGQFAVRGIKPPEPVRLAAYKTNHHQPEEVILDSGSARLVLVRNARLRGVLQAPNWLPSGAVLVSVRGPDDVPHRLLPKIVRGDDNARLEFYFDDLHAGPHAVAAHIQGVPEPVSLQETTLEPGEARDADTVDLRGKLQRVAVRLLGPDGAPWRARARVIAVLPTKEGQRAAAWPVATGYRLLTLPQRDVPMFAVAPGHRLTPLAAAEDVEVTLQPAYRIELQCGIPAEARGPGSTLLVGLVPTADRLPQPVHEASLPGTATRTIVPAELGLESFAPVGTGTVSLRLSAAGNYRPVLRVLRTGKEATDIGLGAAITVVDQDDAQRLEVPIDETLRQKLQGLGR